MKPMAKIEGLFNMFNVLCLENNELVTVDGSLLAVEDGSLANVLAQEYTNLTGKKHQVRRAENTGINWKKRESDRIASKEYEKPAWLYRYTSKMIDAGYLDHAEDHFLHVSKRDPSKIAFTLDATKGAADIQTPMRVGAYLTYYCPRMTPELVREIALEHANIYAPRVLKIATTADEIESIYKNGPNSCMSKNDHYFASSVHPVRVYGNSDLALAYVADADDNITGRALVWRDKKLYGRIYGDLERMQHALKGEGYEAGDFEGAKLRAIYCTNTHALILPYLDGIQRASVERIDGINWVIITEDGEIDATSTSGLIQNASCDRCENGCDENDLNTVYTSRRYAENWCDRCRDNHSFYCEGVGETVSDDCAVTVDGETYASWYREDDRNFCDYAGEYTFEDVVEVFTLTNTAHRDWASSARVEMTIKISENWRKSAIDDGEAFKCRIDGNYWKARHLVTDLWTDEPRSIANYPEDKPDWYVGTIAHNDANQYRLGLTA
jgi:hypothetical protein